jgi:hypothetical protein
MSRMLADVDHSQGPNSSAGFANRVRSSPSLLEKNENHFLGIRYQICGKALRPSLAAYIEGVRYVNTH